MKFVIAPDKFKGSLTAFEFCDAVEEGLLMAQKNARIFKLPLADGGDGTIDVAKHHLNGEKIELPVNDPFFRTIEAAYLYSPHKQIAFIEMAEASGLKLLKDSERNCIKSTTFGTGELIADALERGAKEIILGIGGSATNDGGMGMATALGVRFLDTNNNELEPIGGNLINVAKIDSTEINNRLENVSIRVACDVVNPLYGKNGAVHIYAEQKGASKEAILDLDRGLRNFAEIISRQFGIDVQEINGAGAAGGMGAGALVFLNAQLTSGIDLIKELADFDNAIEGADWIVTGEGRLDAQTLSGKTIDGVLRSAAQKNIPVAALCGSVDISVSEQKDFGLAYAASITKGVSSLEEAIRDSYTNLVFAAYNFANSGVKSPRTGD